MILKLEIGGYLPFDNHKRVKRVITIETKDGFYLDGHGGKWCKLSEAIDAKISSDIGTQFNCVSIKTRS